MNKKLLVNAVPSRELHLTGVVAGANITSVFKGNCSYPFEDVIGYTFNEVKENILADKDIIEKWHPVRLWSEQIDCFRLYKRSDPEIFVDFTCKDGQFMYDCNEKIIVPHDVRKSYLNKSHYQKLGLTKGVIAKMLEVEKIHQSLSYIGLTHLAKMVQHRVWDNSKIEAIDVFNYQKYMHSRSCTGCLCGKTTAQPQVRTEDIVYKHIGESICFDLLFLTTEVNQKKSTACIGLLGIDSYSLFKTIVWIKRKDEKSIVAGIQKTINYYKSFGHKVREIRMDNERGAINLQEYLAISDPGVLYNPSLPDGHVALVESTIRHLKNLWRATILGVDLDGMKVPRKLYKAAFVDCLHSSNKILTTVNDYIPPADMFYNKKACYRNYLTLKWGSIVSCRAINIDEKDESSRVDYGIIVGRNKQHELSGFMVYNLETQKIVVRGNCTEIDCTRKIKELIAKIDDTNDAISCESKPGLHIQSNDNNLTICIPILDDVDELGDSFDNLQKQAINYNNTEQEDNYYINYEQISDEVDDIRNEISEKFQEGPTPVVLGEILSGADIPDTDIIENNDFNNDSYNNNNNDNELEIPSSEIYPGHLGYAIDNMNDNGNITIEGDQTNNPMKDYTPNISENRIHKKSMYKFMTNSVLYFSL